MPKRAAATSSDCSAAKLPKSVAAAQAILKGKNLECTGPALKENLDAKAYLAVTSAFRSACSDKQAEQYRLLQNDAERRDFVAQFVMDPVEFKAVGRNKVTVSNETLDESQGQWLMECQIASSKFLNDDALAKTLCASGELPSRPHEFECFRKQDLKQYFFKRSLIKTLTGVKDEATVEIDSSLTKAEYAEVADGMRDSMGKSITKKKTQKKPKEADPPELVQLRQEISNRKAILGKLQKTFNAFRNEVSVASNLIPSIQSRGFPAEFCKFLKKQLDDAMKNADGAAQLYAQEVVKPEQKDPANLATVQASNTELEEKVRVLDGQLTAARRGVLTDVKRNSASA